MFYLFGVLYNKSYINYFQITKITNNKKFRYISLIGMCPSRRVWFLRRFENGYSLESAMVFEETMKVYERIYNFNSK